MLLAADFSLMCRLPSASVLIGQDAVMTKPGLDQTRRQSVPGPARLVGEHDHHHAVRLHHSAALGKDGGHPLLVVAAGKSGACLASEPERVGDRLTILVGQVATRTRPGKADQPSA